MSVPGLLQIWIAQTRKIDSASRFVAGIKKAGATQLLRYSGLRSSGQFHPQRQLARYFIPATTRTIHDRSSLTRERILKHHSLL